MSEPDRRSLLKSAAAAAALGLIESGTAKAAAGKGLQFGPARPFSFALLKEQARKRVREPYVGPPHPAPGIVSEIDYEAWGQIKFDMTQALYANGPGQFPVSFFHLGKFFRKAVGMHVVEAGHEREIIYDPSYFEMPEDSPARQLPKGAGFAGLRVQEARDGTLDWRKNDWIAFLGADYFRAIGALHQYGLSCRAIALDVAVAGKPEEFPDFTHIYIDESEPRNGLTLYALLEGPSIVGACKMEAVRGKGVTMDIEQMLCLRRDITRFGVAPLTSMYWFSETVKPTAVDWRPEVHDSDGLAMWTGGGERVWRPLNNPAHIMASAFLDHDPRGFGLMQRDRNFDHYQDGVFYDRRPSLWVEPKGEWGKGSVQLVEIPTDDEIHDNIVAMWVPEKPVTAGAELEIGYKLYWLADEPYPSPLAHCVATRLGNGGQPGQPRPQGVRKFMVEFLGAPLASLPYGVKPEAVLWASRGTFSYIYTEAVPDDVPGHWRAQFDLTVTGTEPVEMRLFLRAGGKILSETWAYQYHPWVDCRPSCYPKTGL
ncbi:glucan biosynthesis protein [Methylovirgula sp. HY1]|uniref:glucan biosynthesis protein n=1 Tax=Methylovirgula sp. HY1 TaxID=2822761 RepID=UPI001C5AA995|nr:glucan biosynthesis protein D [Methylovirgula sp. HY1]QXX75321.1 Glucans biosynthesis protein D [Methylovirgula sp. HY1]